MHHHAPSYHSEITHLPWLMVQSLKVAELRTGRRAGRPEAAAPEALAPDQAPVPGARLGSRRSGRLIRRLEAAEKPLLANIVIDVELARHLDSDSRTFVHSANGSC